MKNSYNKEYFEDTLKIIGDNLNDLSTWSAYNKDKYNDEIDQINKLFNKIEELEKEIYESKS